MHEVLAHHCGECHASHRPTALPPALAVFDLDRPDWPQHFDASRFEVALARLQDKPEADQALFRAFRDAQLGRR